MEEKLLFCFKCRNKSPKSILNRVKIKEHKYRYYHDECLPKRLESIAYKS